MLDSLELPSKMDVALQYQLLTLFTLFTLNILFKLLYTASTVACIGVVILQYVQKVGVGAVMDEWMEGVDTLCTVMTTRAPAVLKNTKF